MMAVGHDVVVGHLAKVGHGVEESASAVQGAVAQGAGLFDAIKERHRINERAAAAPLNETYSTAIRQFE